jgi:hypothetical protein
VVRRKYGRADEVTPFIGDGYDMSHEPPPGYTVGEPAKVEVSLPLEAPVRQPDSNHLPTTQLESTLGRHYRFYIEKAHREHDLLVNRTNIFLVYHSILMAGFALGSDTPSATPLLAVLGFIGGCIWVYVGHRSLLTARYFWDRVLVCESTMPDTDRVITEFLEWRDETRIPIIGFPVETYIAKVLPIVWVLTWAAVAILELAL